MNARKKLNSIYFAIGATIAGFAGLVTQSAIVFIICLAIVTGVMLNDGTIRTNPIRK